MKVLSIDIETYSSEEITNGVYKYVSPFDFNILLFAYSVDGGPVEVVDLASGEEIPEEIFNTLEDENILKTAFNAMFERVCLDKHFKIKSTNWECTMIKAWTLGIGGGLAGVGKALGLEQQKMTEGKRLIQLFCAPTKKTGFLKGGRVLPKDAPDDWELFKDYNKRDVEVELAIRDKLNRFEMVEFEKALYKLDQKINDRGVLIDTDMVKNAIKIDQEMTEWATNVFQNATGMENPNSLVDIKNYIQKNTGDEVSSITKGNLNELIQKYSDHEDIVTALEMRQLLSRTSTAKYPTMLNVVGEDERARGQIQHYGAYRTGRWAGRGIQVHNLPQNHIRDLDTARKLVKSSDFEFLNMMYDDPADILSQCIRPAIIPAKGKKFVVADFSAIEARVIAWLAGEGWVLEVFEGHGKIYEAAASRMFGIPVELIDKGSDLRQKGKVATLALGYQGGAGALKAMGAVKMGIPEAELQDIVAKWRKANSKIVSFWYAVQKAVIEAIEDKTTVSINGQLKAIYRSGILFLELPSGRRLAYPKISLGDHPKWDGVQIRFKEVNSAGTGWIDKDTYGGRLVENIVQATARDCLGYSMLQLDKAGYEIVMHVHDEVVIEADENADCLDDVCTIMGMTIPWAQGLPLRADGYECFYYRKD